ncbi:hypothetical protein [Daejeonella sp.]|uniref:hypothetical protein n=1 Tax=Daejeonella sp. TaxID=2805397 RepID=UPI0025C25B5D|nr:hypothetical protein [Daejeonella sp.]
MARILKFNFTILTVVFLTIFSFVSNANSQGKLIKQEDSVIVNSAKIEEIPDLINSLANLLPQKRIYLMNELHWVKMNNLIRNDLVRSLHQKKKVNCFLIELNHSFAFGMNLFLKYGDTKILADFDGYDQTNMVDTAKFYERIKNLYQYNIKQDRNNRIRYIGIDFEIDKNRTREYVVAMEYFMRLGKDKLPLSIIEILKEIKQSDIGNVKYLIMQNEKLLTETQKYKSEIAKALGDIFLDYMLIINAPNKIPFGRRDGDMISTLNYAVQILQETGTVKEPIFMGSFGKAHIFPEDGNSFSSLVQKSEYFKNNTSLIGVQYVNCLSRYKNETPNPIENDGLSIKNKATKIVVGSYLKSISDETNMPIILLNNIKKSNVDYFRFYDAILIYTGG